MALRLRIEGVGQVEALRVRIKGFGEMGSISG